MEIKILFRQGKSIREISRLLCISRNTVRRYLRREEKPSYKSRSVKRQSKLTPFYTYLQQRIQAAHPQWLPATVLHREIRELGYQGQASLLRSYLRQLKPQLPPEPLVRFETPPGKQMQVDWVCFRRSPQALSAFVATLGYSRASFVEFVTDEKLETLLVCHEKAFHYFGGVPEEILYDNMKTVVVTRDAYAKSKHRFQAGFLDFAKHYHFMPRLCRPYRAKTKGKVERFNRYLRYSFYYPLVSRLKPLGLVLDKELANYEVNCWLRDVANARRHATTEKIPAVCLEKEKSFLQPLTTRYTGIAPIAPIASMAKMAVIDTWNLQHALTIYDQLLEQETRV